MENTKKYVFNPDEVGKRIRDERKKHSMTQEQLSAHLNLSADTVSNYERGNTLCPPDVILMICQLFNTTSDYIYFGIEDKSSNTKQCSIFNIIKKLEELDEEDLRKLNQFIDIFYKKR